MKGMCPIVRTAKPVLGHPERQFFPKCLPGVLMSPRWNKTHS